MATRIYKTPFAATGDKEVLATADQPDGKVSLQTGWTPDYELPNDNANYRPVGRAEMNGILSEITEGLGEIQLRGFAIWQSIDGGWPVGAIVTHENTVYRSSIDGNTNMPGASGSGWRPVISASEPTKTVMTSSGTWTRPAGCVRIRIRLQGGGAGGSSGTSVDGATGRGGGGGAYLEAVIASPPATASVIIGAAGAGAVPGSALQATNGGATTFAGTYSAGGGEAPLTMSALASGASSPGGIAAGGDINVHGYASSGSIGSTTVPLSGKGADSYFGSGGQAIVSAGVGDNATGYGAGGGGSVRGGGVNYNGGNGAPGIAIIEEFYV
ncbi:hypothetical protein F1536_23315 [Achromobacter xylosoxidans]|uniref:glycine-rich domain-containing protein n=1 Tax=Alcaligenes xylosoxydans xylosoxydans TaxID=85698 RepID=UPI0012328600|nr:hypothetical protein [Achromobacter xylosoxidans]KAA5921371.1 hypothetical protein F1536_23315 [Achromobacter xylosoxidans]